MHRLAALFALALLSACLGDDGTDDETGDGDGDCDASHHADAVVADSVHPNVALAVSDELIAYVTRDGVENPTVLHLVRHDGTGEVVLYTSGTSRSIVSIDWAGSDLLFLEGDDGESTTELYRMAIIDDVPTRVGTATFSEAVEVLGTDGSAAYVLRGDPGPTVDRVELAIGEVSSVGSAPGNGTPMAGLIDDGEIFFMAGSDFTVYRLTVNDDDAEATALFSGVDHPECGFPLGGLAVTSTAIVCGYTDVMSFTRGGEPNGVIVEGDVLGPGHIVAAASGNSVYMIEVNDGTVDRGLRSVHSDGGAVREHACDVGQVAYQTASGWFPVQNAYQIEVGGGRIVWAEERLDEDSSTKSFSIRSAAL